jgi:hypothetical protein
MALVCLTLNVYANLLHLGSLVLLKLYNPYLAYLIILGIIFQILLKLLYQFMLYLNVNKQAVNGKTFTLKLYNKLHYTSNMMLV